MNASIGGGGGGLFCAGESERKRVCESFCRVLSGSSSMPVIDVLPPSAFAGEFVSFMSLDELACALSKLLDIGKLWFTTKERVAGSRSQISSLFLTIIYADHE